MTLHGLGLGSLLIGAVVLGLGCGAPLKTGTTKKPNNKPADDGSCPSERSPCGAGAFTLCVDLQNDPDHCGTCDRVCSVGIACEAGVCQQTVCTGAIPFADQPTTSAPATGTHASGVDGYVVLADVNGDGDADLIDYQVAWSNLNSFRVFLGQPGGGFATPDTYHASSDIRHIFATDVDDDGLDDLLVVSSAIPSIPPYHVEVWLGRADGRLAQTQATGVSATINTLAGADMAVGDISGDGLPDLVMPSDHDSGRLSVYLSDSTGALHLSNTYATGGAAATYLRDWNGDGSPDLVVLTSSMEILYNRGDGTFERSLDCGVLLPDGAVFGVVVSDFDHDGRMDLAVSARKGTSLGVLLGLGECRFAPFSYYEVPGGALSSLLAADMNGDGQLDLVSIGMGPPPEPRDHRLSVLLGNPDGTFRQQGTPVSLGSDSITDVAIGETTGDRRPDVVIAGPDGQAKTWQNACQ